MDESGFFLKKATDFKQTGSVVKCEYRACVANNSHSLLYEKRLLLLLLTGHSDIIVLGREEGTHIDKHEQSQQSICAHRLTYMYMHAHTHPLNGILPQHQ